MARPLRIEFPGAIHHVTFRGNERRMIFRSDADRHRMLEQLADTQRQIRARLYLVCLMPNHVHLLLETPDRSLGEFMGRWLTAYAVYFNRRHRRAGHLTQGRYAARLVEGDLYLSRLSRYIHLNPVCGKKWEGVEVAERRRFLREYRWSTYRSYAGLEPRWEWIDYAPIHASVTAVEGSASAGYRAYVETGLSTSDATFRELYRCAQLSMGSEPFQEHVRELHTQAKGGVRRPEDASLRRVRARNPAAMVLRTVAAVLGVPESALRQRRRGSLLRAAAAWALRRHAGLNQRAIAAELGVASGAAISLQLARWRRATAPGNPWTDTKDRIEQALTSGA